jgi:hypothetical protein
MQNQTINAGDSVVFTQRYQPEDPLSRLHGHTGIVLEMQGNSAIVDFDHAAVTVNLADIESAEESDELPAPGTDTITLIDDHECSGMSRAQLIAHKLIAQEGDPKLDHELTELLNVN